MGIWLLQRECAGEGLQKPILCVYTVKHCKKVGFWNVVKRCYCSEIMDMDLHVDKMTKITHWCLKKIILQREMGQKEHKALFKLCPIDHNITMHCPIPPLNQIPSQGPLHSLCFFPLCQYMQPHTLKSFRVNDWNYIHPTCTAQLLGCYSWKKK